LREDFDQVQLGRHYRVRYLLLDSFTDWQDDMHLNGSTSAQRLQHHAAVLCSGKKHPPNTAASLSPEVRHG
jgi:hypothetical protein